MRKAMWWAAGAGLFAAAVAFAKPPERPATNVEGRVPVYPDGEQFRESAVPDPQPQVAPKSNRATPAQPRIWWFPQMNLLLPPIKL
jgi:hypothetical protein